MVFILGTQYLYLRALRLHTGQVCCKRTRHYVGFEFALQITLGAKTVYCVFQVMTLLMLAFRMRSVAVRSILCKPCALLAAITCQAVLMPMVSWILGRAAESRAACVGRRLLSLALWTVP